MLIAVTGLHRVCAELSKSTQWSEQVLAMRCGVSLGTWQRWAQQDDDSVRSNELFVRRLVRLGNKHGRKSYRLVAVVGGRGLYNVQASARKGMQRKRK